MGHLRNVVIVDEDELGFNYFAYISGEGVPNVVFARTAEELKTANSFSILVSENPDAVEPKCSDIERKAKLWVIKNREILLRYWDDSFQFGATKDFLKRLRRISDL